MNFSYIIFRRKILIFNLLLICIQSSAALSADRAEQLYSLCVACHGAQGEGNKSLEAPAIAGLPLWYLQKQLMNFRNGVRGLHPADGAGMRMRPMARTIPSEKDLMAVGELVSKMKPVDQPATVEGSPVKGMNAYAVCSTCHGLKGEGNEALGAPQLVGQSDWYLLKQLKNFKEGIRGANPAIDPMGATMAPMAATLADEQAMKDVVSYIHKLK